MDSGAAACRMLDQAKNPVFAKVESEVCQLRTAGVLTADARENELGNARHFRSTLFYAAQEDIDANVMRGNGTNELSGSPGFGELR